jgi:hypothetical protein
VGVGWQAALSGAIAGSVGVAELLGRYKSSPGFSLRRLAAWTYVLVNAGAGVLALYLVRAFGWTFNQTQHVTLWRILVAGFGAVALFRSSLFITKVGSTDLNVGPSLVLGALLDACDRAIDRESATKISEVIAGGKLDGLDPDAVQLALPVLCLALMQNFAAADQALLATDLNKIKENAELTPNTKMRAVIIQLAKYLGPAVVETTLTDGRVLFSTPPAAAAALPTDPQALQAAILPKVAELRSHAPQDPAGPPAA